MELLKKNTNTVRLDQPSAHDYPLFLSPLRISRAVILILLSVLFLSHMTQLMSFEFPQLCKIFPIGWHRTFENSYIQTDLLEQRPIQEKISRLDCSTFDPSDLRLITFDVFAALMDLVPSLENGVMEAVPELRIDQARAIANDSMNGYGSYMNTSFTPEQTKGLEPFQFVIQSTLETSVINRGLTSLIPVGGEKFWRILEGWGNLIPRQNTKPVLAKLQHRYLLAPLSNGDKRTLAHAMNVLAPQVHMSRFIFSSDFPVAVFKPLAPIYSQVLFPNALCCTLIISYQLIWLCAGAEDLVNDFQYKHGEREGIILHILI